MVSWKDHESSAICYVLECTGRDLWRCPPSDRDCSWMPTNYDQCSGPLVLLFWARPVPNFHRSSTEKDTESMLVHVGWLLSHFFTVAHDYKVKPNAIAKLLDISPIIINNDQWFSIIKIFFGVWFLLIPSKKKTKMYPIVMVKLHQRVEFHSSPMDAPRWPMSSRISPGLVMSK